MNKPRMEIIDNGYKPERSFVIQGYECKICEMKFVFWRDMKEHLIEEHEESKQQVSYIPLIKYFPSWRARA
jgi:hypothetical protein